jgi:FtsZ-interacting cell division protein ZipA
MNTILIILVVGIIVIAAIATWGYVQNRRTKALSSRFGPEYQHAVSEYGSRSRAERALERRAERAEKYQIRSLKPEEQQRFSEEWRTAQARFVDDPALAIREADHLVCEVMRQRGYPVSDFEQRAEDLSVDHPLVVRNYRAAHSVALMEKEGKATTEDLRKAMVSYRELFDELLEAHAQTRAILTERRG